MLQVQECTETEGHTPSCFLYLYFGETVTSPIFPQHVIKSQNSPNAINHVADYIGLSFVGKQR